MPAGSTSLRRACTGSRRSSCDRASDHRRHGALIDTLNLENGNGLSISVLPLGAILQSVLAPDREGRIEEITLGLTRPEDYLRDRAYLGAVVGRYANRIANARFTLDGVEHRLTANDGPNTLHGGRRGLGRAEWSMSHIVNGDGPGIELNHQSPDGDEGFPGVLDTRVTYTLTADDRLVVDYEATSDRPTPINLSQHSYWNLGGPSCADILGHEIQLHAEYYTPVDAALIPTGEIRPVAGSVFDLRAPARIGDRLRRQDPQVDLARGFDHNFVLERAGDGLSLAARLAEPRSGRTMEVWTTEPGLQFYTGNFLDGSVMGRGGRPLAARSGCCLETQHFPDSPNRPNFPSTILRPGAAWRSRTVFRFGRVG